MSNAGIAQKLHLSIGVVEKNVGSIFMKLDLSQSQIERRRWLAVLRFLQS
ncbi:DNA-binding NarL/FixJ family response regulator [Pseudarthrobacter sp. PvP004]|nr:hypothetical protein [Pseudarthrobacter sp. PvP004]MBP2269147.1 DNA-binding NarL/FixJ family response regulator [Pseudarthrobacter sp. PvP004]